MQYVYAAMLLHSAKKEINEANVEAVLKSAQLEFDEARVKAMVSSLKNINIDEAIAKATTVTVATPQASTAPPAEDKATEEETKKNEEEAAAGLGALFG